MLVRNVMSSKVIFCTPSDTAQAAARIMKLHGVGALPVVTDLVQAKLEGIVTDRDLCCRVIAEAKPAEKTRIAEVMTRNPVVCAPEDSLEECEALMQQHQFRRIPVVEQTRAMHRNCRPGRYRTARSIGNCGQDPCGNFQVDRARAKSVARGRLEQLAGAC